MRVISRLDIKGEKLIKGIKFEGLRPIGCPIQKAKEYYNNGIDEIICIDTVASLYGRNNAVKFINFQKYFFTYNCLWWNKNN